MLKHVLVPLDSSTLAEQALAHAQSLLETGGKISLVMAVEVPATSAPGLYPAFGTIPLLSYEELKEEMSNEALTYLEHVAANQRENGFDSDTRVQLGDPAAVIIDAARELHVEAIVMSTHGRSGLSRWLFGSVANKVLSAAPCPIYLIPSKVQQRKASRETAEMHYG